MKVRTNLMMILVFAVILSLSPLNGVAFAAENGLMLHYKFNGNFNDSSGNGYNGSVVGAVTLEEDNIVGKHAVFNGGFINVPGSSALNLGNNFTIAVWVMVDAAKNSGNKTVSIISKLNDKNTHNTFHAFARGTFGARMDALFGKGGNYVLTGGAFDNYGLGGNWTHLLFSCDGDRLYLYVNGVLKGSSREIKGGEAIVPSTGNIRIGTGNDTNSQNLFFLGKMADVRIYNRSLSVGEIQSLFNAGTK